jgi:hypothetical protein
MFLTFCGSWLLFSIVVGMSMPRFFFFDTKITSARVVREAQFPRYGWIFFRPVVSLSA